MLQAAPESVGTEVHPAFYLPVDWIANGSFPVIVEYTENEYPKTGSVGKIEHANLGDGLRGGKNYVWVSMRYIELGRQKNARAWWGDRDATIEYHKTNAPRICETFGGNQSNVFICGFAFGEIAASDIELADDNIARLSKTLFTHDHFDGDTTWRSPDSDHNSALF